MRSSSVILGTVPGILLADLATIRSEVPGTLTDSDQRVSRLISAASRSIGNYIGRPFLDQTIIETFDMDLSSNVSYDPKVFALRARPITSVSSVTFAGATLDPLVDQVGWIYSNDAGIITVPALTYSGRPFAYYSSGQFIFIYRAGYIPFGLIDANKNPIAPTIPDDIVQACISTVAMLRSNAAIDPNIKMEQDYRVGQVQYSTYSKGTGFLDPGSMDALDYYRDIGF